MGIDFGFFWAADFNNDIRFYVRRPARRQKVTRRPPSHQNSITMTDISIWVSILGFFGPLISMVTLDLPSADLPAGQRSPAARRHTKFNKYDRYINIGLDFGVLRAADFDGDIRFTNNAIRLDVRRSASRPKVPRRPPSHQNSKMMPDISSWVSIFGVVRAADFDNHKKMQRLLNMLL